MILYDNYDVCKNGICYAHTIVLKRSNFTQLSISTNYAHTIL